MHDAVRRSGGVSRSRDERPRRQGLARTLGKYRRQLIKEHRRNQFRSSMCEQTRCSLLVCRKPLIRNEECLADSAKISVFHLPPKRIHDRIKLRRDWSGNSVVDLDRGSTAKSECAI